MERKDAEPRYEYRLARRYEAGCEDLPEDTDRAKKLYGRAAEKGHPDAMYRLGRMYRKVWEKEFRVWEEELGEKRMIWRKEFRDKGLQEKELDEKLKDEELREREQIDMKALERAVELYREAGRRGQTESQYELGDMTDSGSFGAWQDRTEQKTRCP